ncbi:hypothetical protein PGA94_09320 [Pediococcus pentosaceus]|uniref:hypothetical protein n=1 Tax=Pediococcus pentosaceus TaxID=1255 RepID=UPI00232CC50C|nr:hypothetical protein [Pediococcus pentosaceus]MDB1562973.1 hypothetical protein [Pediococcus pentosaceus]
MSFFSSKPNEKYIIKIGERFIDFNPIDICGVKDEIYFTDEPIGAWSTESLFDAQRIANTFGGQVLIANLDLKEVE